MFKKEFAAEVADKAGVTNAVAGKVIDAAIEALTELLANGDKLQITGFGVFEAKERAEREGINPLTQEKITVAACKVPSFKASKALKDAVNGGDTGDEE
ncbi:MAG: HU family DNA-binding protein [Clostridia bacterium]|nr:HU family DNA-binding protein [Clostridia bacterium]